MRIPRIRDGRCTNQAAHQISMMEDTQSFLNSNAFQLKRRREGWGKRSHKKQPEIVYRETTNV